jgi:UDP-GlcNAc:undecaprenyl-phosphate GlcNAc-1-phosphate transferase
MKNVVIIFLVSSLSAACVIPKIIHFSLRLKLFDDQDLYRKGHSKLVSRMGGIGIFFGYISGLSIYVDLNSLEMHALLSSTLILFFLGLKDDLLGGASPLEKFSIQFLAASVLVLFGGFETINIISLENDIFHRALNAFLIVCIVLLVVNAFNFIDGINGLAGVIGVFLNVFLGYYLLHWDDYNFGFIAFILAGAISGFLFHNFIPNKVFMGDSGAMVIGLTTLAICLRFIIVSTNVHTDGFPLPELIILALLVVPIFDVIRIFIIRSLHKKPLLMGDRNHLHHRLKDLGMRDFQVVLILVGFTGLSVTIAIVGQNNDAATTSISLGLLCIISNGILTYIRGLHLSKAYRFIDILFVDTLNKR